MSNIEFQNTAFFLTFGFLLEIGYLELEIKNIDYIL
jgi:hypothetical protein